MYTACPKLYTCLCVVILMLLSGCGGAATQYYVLSTVSPVIKVEAADSNINKVYQISIRELQIPRYLDRPRMVSRDTENHLRIAETHQWGGRLRDNLSRTLADDLAERLPAVTILTAPFSSTMRSKASLLIDVRQFELLADGHMHLKLRWYLQQTDVDGQYYVDHLISENKIGERDYAAMAASMSALLAQLAEKIAVVISNLDDVK